MVGSHRIERLNAQFRRELSRLLLTDIKDPRVLGVTVTEVRVTKDLSYARVFVRLADPENAAGAIEGLERAAGFLRRRLGQAVRLRKTPELRFDVDETIEHADRIEELLRQTRRGESDDERGET